MRTSEWTVQAEGTLVHDEIFRRVVSTATDLREFRGWLEQTRGLSPHSVRAYLADARRLHAHLDPDGKTRTPDPDDLRSFLKSQRSEGLTESTIRRRWAGARIYCAWLVAEGFLARDPSKELDLRFRRSARLPRVVDESDLGLVLQALSLSPGISERLEHQDLNTQIAVSLMLSTGVRVGEVAALKTQDVSLSSGSVRVVGKGSRERVVYLTSDALTNLVRKHLTRRQQQQITHDSLLYSSRGGPMTTGALRARLRAVRTKAQVPGPITPHMLRHTAATQLIESGVDIRYVQRLLGHASISTTEIYTHVTDVALKRELTRANVWDRLVDN